MYQIVMMLGIPSLISGLCMLAINRGIVRRDEARRLEDAEREKKRAAAEVEQRKRDQAMEAQQAVVEKQNNALMAAVQAMLRDRLLQGYRHYFAQGWADYDDRENLENIWQQYHALGANGVMDGVREKFLALPVNGGCMGGRG